MELDFPALWQEAVLWPGFLRAGMEQYELWKGVYEHVVLPGWALEEAMASPLRKMLVLAADWCGDAANSVPVAARLAELVPGMELRMLERDQYPEVMNRYLTNGTRSIPMVIALDDGLGELGHWGPRPIPLQEWVMANKKMIPSPQRYAYARRWYAKDRGATMLRELLDAARRPG